MDLVAQLTRHTTTRGGHFLKQKKTIQNLYKIVKSHIGSNTDDAHLPADEMHNGFMTRQHVQDLSQAQGKYLTPDNNHPIEKDILKMPVGCWFGSGLVNTPDGTGDIFMVDVLISTDNRKLIRAMSTITGEMWEYNKSPESYMLYPDGWTRQERVKELWSGAVSEVGSAIKLSDNINNYRKLRVTLNFPGGYVVKTSIIAKDNMYNFADVLSSDATPSVINGKVILSTVDNTHLKITRNKTVQNNNGSFIVSTSANTIIKKIEGLK